MLLDLAPDYLAYERKIYNLNNLLKDVGGLFTSMFLIAKTAFQFFALPLYYSSLIQEAYFVKKSQKK